MNLQDELQFEEWWNEQNADEKEYTLLNSFMKEKFKKAWIDACNYKDSNAPSRQRRIGKVKRPRENHCLG